MKQKEVTINGVQYPVVFTLDTLFGVEDILNGSFFEANFGTLKNRMALVLAAIYSADDKADITVDGDDTDTTPAGRPSAEEIEHLRELMRQENERKGCE